MATGECETLVGSGSTILANPTLSEKLQRKREGLESELAAIKAAEEILAVNPELKKLFDIVSKVRCF